MGWTGILVSVSNKEFNRKQFLDSEFTYEFKNNGTEGMCEVVKSSMVGSTWYGAIHYHSKAPISGIEKDYVYGMVILTQFKNNEFMYKEIPETAGPNYYDCPQSILNLLSPCSEIEDYRDWAKEWREKCVKQRKITLAKRHHLSLKVSWLKEERKLVWTHSGKRGFYTDGVYRYSSRYLNANNIIEVDGKPV